MINLTKRQQAATFTALLDEWDVGELDNPEAVKRHTYAELIAFDLPHMRVVQSVANVINRVMYAKAEKARYNYWRCDIDELAALVGSYHVARLALGLCGFWASTCSETGRIEWSDNNSVGGARNDVVLPAYLSDFRLSDRVAG